MIVRMRTGADETDIAYVISRAQGLGFRTHVSIDGGVTLIGLLGEAGGIGPSTFSGLAGVDTVLRSRSPFRLASRDYRSAPTEVKVGDVVIGGDDIVIMAGPCSVESRDQLMTAALGVSAAGANMLRGGAFKPRSSPYSFQGLGEEGLKYLAEARDETGMRVVTEVMAPEQVPLVSRYADLLQVGARNVQNFPLLKAIGQSDMPVLLKRGMMSTIEELLLSAEYILSGGNPNVILCERGIRTFESLTRNTLDINAVPLLKALTHLPVVVDPSHATGRSDLVGAVSRAAVAAGADGLLIEVHPNPAKALSDGPQSLTPGQLAQLIPECRRVAAAIGRGARQTGPAVTTVKGAAS